MRTSKVATAYKKVTMITSTHILTLSSLRWKGLHFLLCGINKLNLDYFHWHFFYLFSPLSVRFMQIYNQWIETGIVPNTLKVSQVTPVYKNGDATDPANYRPISTLSSFSKVFEKLTHNQLYNFLEKYSILYKYQFGFRKGYSIEQAILEITDSLKKAMDKKLVTCSLFLDFSKALMTQLTMIFCYWNSIDMVYTEILSDGLKTTYTIVIRSSKLVTLYLEVRPLSGECLRDQLWVHSYFCFILMICQTVQSNYPSEYLLMTLICFIQLIICITLSLSWMKNLSQ